MDITKLEPEKVFRHFQEISRIPRNSGDTKKISDYLAGFAKDNELEYYQDDWNDVIIIKEGSEGRENEEPLIMQGHMDMVCARTEDSPLDPAKDGVDVIIDGDYVHADRTSLGGDDGIAIAMRPAALAPAVGVSRLVQAIINITTAAVRLIMHTTSTNLSNLLFSTFIGRSLYC